MEKEPFWKRELKELAAIGLTFYIMFTLFMLLKTMILEKYQIKFHAAGTALIGALILAKVVLIMDNLHIHKKYGHLPKIYAVFFRSFIYLIGFAIFSILEEWIKVLIKGMDFMNAWEEAFAYLGSLTFITTGIIVFISFLFFNTFWMIRERFGPKALYQLFFKRGN